MNTCALVIRAAFVAVLSANYCFKPAVRLCRQNRSGKMCFYARILDRSGLTHTCTCRLIQACVDSNTLIPRLSGLRSYGHFGLPGTIWASFRGNITTLLSLFVEILTSYAISMAFSHQDVYDSELRAPSKLRAVSGPEAPG